MKPRSLLPAALLAYAASLAGCSPPAAVVPPVTIVVQPGRFGDIEAAAGADTLVDWWDADSGDDDACTESFAALELRHFLAPCLGLDERAIRLSAAKSLPPAGDVFVLGSRRSNPLVAALAGGVDARASKDPEGFRIRALTRGRRSVFVIEGNSRAGTLYGAYALLERLGARFYGLGATGTVLPPRPVRLPRRLDIASAPGFTIRGFWAWEPRGDREFFLWMARNRMNLWTCEERNPAFLKKLGLVLTAGGHGIQQNFLNPDAEYAYDLPGWRGDEGKPRDPYAPGGLAPKDLNHDGRLSNFEAHPEWFALRGGKRSGNLRGEWGDNYCTSNPDATRELARNLIRSLAGGPWRHADVVHLWMLDNGGWCECDRCRAQGGPTDRMLGVLAGVGAELADARRTGSLRRPVRLVGAAYIETLAPPTRPAPAGFDTSVCSVEFFPYFRCYAHALGDPSCTEFNRARESAYTGWTTGPDRPYSGPVGIGEYYNVSFVKSLPIVYAHVMGTDLPWYHRHGAREFHYMHAPTRLWGTWTLNHAVLSRLLWDPSVPVDSVVAGFCRDYYPTTAQRMRAFYADLETATCNILAIEHCAGAFTYRGAPAGRLTAREAPLFTLRHLQFSPTGATENVAPSWAEIIAAMSRARAGIDAALAACSDSTERRRLLEDERRFAYGETMFALYDRLIGTAWRDHAGDVAGARRAFGPADSLAARLRAIHDLVQVSASHANAADGLEASNVAATYEYFRARYGGPHGARGAGRAK